MSGKCIGQSRLRLSARRSDVRTGGRCSFVSALAHIMPDFPASNSTLFRELGVRAGVWLHRDAGVVSRRLRVPVREKQAERSAFVKGIYGTGVTESIRRPSQDGSYRSKPAWALCSIQQKVSHLVRRPDGAGNAPSVPWCISQPGADAITSDVGNCDFAIIDSELYLLDHVVKRTQN